jgi:hypothetical protein
MSIGIVEKLSEPQASSFPPDGRHEPILILFKQPRHSVPSNRARFNERDFCLLRLKAPNFGCSLTKVSRSQSAALRNAFDFDFGSSKRTIKIVRYRQITEVQPQTAS